MSVTVVFSDGSKRASRNTDELRERWEMRKEVDTEIIRSESLAGYPVPTFRGDETHVELQELVGTYGVMSLAVNARFAQLKPEKQWHRQRVHLALVRESLQRERMRAGIRLKELNILNSEQVKSRENITLRRYAHKLESIIMQLGGELPAVPIEGWKQGDLKPS